MTAFTYYREPADYAGLGYDHRLIAWIDANGWPRSVVIPMNADDSIIESIECAVNEGDYGPFDTEDQFLAALQQALPA